MIRKRPKKQLVSQAEKRSRTDYQGIRAFDFLLLPNLLTLSRLVWAVPALYLVVISDYGDTNIKAAIFLGLAFITDVLDGFVARTFNAISDLGKILDPVIDKVVVFSIAVTLGFADIGERNLPLWLIISVFTRDILILFFSIRVLREDKHLFRSSWSGKVTTFFIAMTLLAFLLQEHINDLVLSTLTWVVLGLLLLSSVDYLEKYWSVRHKHINIKRERRTEEYDEHKDL